MACFFRETGIFIVVEVEERRLVSPRVDAFGGGRVPLSEVLAVAEFAKFGVVFPFAFLGVGLGEGGEGGVVGEVGGGMEVAV